MAARLGIRINIHKVAVSTFDKPRSPEIPRAQLTADWRSVVSDPNVQIVIEAVGGTTVARTMILKALRLGKAVVTANKALLSSHGEELFKTAAKHGANLYYEASVAGGIPMIKILREAFVGNRVTDIYGIVNGTCNYILTRMTQEGAEFEDALADAQRLGTRKRIRRSTSTATISMHKIGILASLAHGFWVKPEPDPRGGHPRCLPDRHPVRPATGLHDQAARRREESLRRRPRETVHQRCGPVNVAVYPTLIPEGHVLASVNHAFNAVFVRGDVVGDTLFYGRGAGRDATASAVLSDLADAALDLKHRSERRVPPFVAHDRQGAVLPIDDVVSRCYLRLSVVDRPGVIARISGVLGQAKISISSIIQPESREGEAVPLILMIHDAPNAVLQKALAQISRLRVVRATPVMMRVDSLG